MMARDAAASPGVRYPGEGGGVDVSREQVLAHRIAAQGLHRDGPGTLERVLDLGIQDSGASAAVAVAARSDAPVPPTALAWTHRGAPHHHRPGELARWSRANRPRDDADAAARLGWSGPEQRRVGIPALAAIDRAADALAAVVTVPMTKGEASTQVTRRLPDALLRECRGCRCTHVNEQLMRLSAAPAGVAIDPDAPTLVLLPPPRGWVPPGAVTVADLAHLARAVLRVLGPGTPAHVAGFAGTATRVLTAVWAEVVDAADLAEVRLDGAAAWLPRQDLDALADPPAPDPVRLLPPFDPLLQVRDRELLVPDPDRRRELYRVLGNPGAVLADGEVVGTWRPRASGRRLALAVTEFEPWSPDVRARVDEEAERVAAARGLQPAGVTR